MSIHWVGMRSRDGRRRSHLFAEGIEGYVALSLIAVGALLAWRGALLLAGVVFVVSLWLWGRHRRARSGHALKRVQKSVLLAGVGSILLVACWQVPRLVDLWFIAPFEPPRTVTLDSMVEAHLSADGALGIGDHPNPTGSQDDRTRIGAEWLDDHRLQVVVQRRNKEYMTQVELWLLFRPPNAPVATARAGSMPLDSPYMWPLIHPQGTVAVNPEGASFSRDSDDATLILEYRLEGHASGSPQETKQRIALASAELR